MQTIVYLIRHSEPFKQHRGEKNTHEPLQIENEKTPLSINGEKIAEEYAQNSEFQNIDVIISSNYVRTMSTAKYFAFNNDLKVNIDDRFNERVHGVNSYAELPNDFEERQMNEPDYKINFGESQKEVQSRMYEALKELLNKCKGKRIVIVSHSTALSFLLKKWCNCKYGGPHIFSNKEFFDGRWDYLQTFKLTFEHEELIDIKSI